MKLAEIREVKSQLKKHMMKGDFITLSKMLDIEIAAARMRYIRDGADAVSAMKLLIDNREEFIRKYRETLGFETINGLPLGFAVLDTTLTDSGSILVVLITNSKIHEAIYENEDSLKKNCYLFIDKILKSDQVSAIITNCPIGYMPVVKQIIKYNGVKRYAKHPFASRSENVLKLLSKQY